MATPLLINIYTTIIGGEEVEVKVYSEGKTRVIDDEEEPTKSEPYIKVDYKEDKELDLVDLITGSKDE
jgi:hypothetical protein